MRRALERTTRLVARSGSGAARASQRDQPAHRLANRSRPLSRGRTWADHRRHASSLAPSSSSFSRRTRPTASWRSGSRSRQYVWQLRPRWRSTPDARELALQRTELTESREAQQSLAGDTRLARQVAETANQVALLREEAAILVA